MEYQYENSQAFIEKYDLLIWHFVYEVHRSCRYLEKEDIYQTLAYKLLLVEKQIDDVRTEKTYVYTSLQNEANRIKKNYYSSSNRINLQVFFKHAPDDASNNDYLNEVADDYFNPEKLYNEKFFFESMKIGIDKICEKHQEIIKLFFKGVPVKEISIKYDMSLKNIYNIIYNFYANLTKNIQK